MIVALIGLLLSVMNWWTFFHNRKSEDFVSGIPLFGGLMILIGFLLSHHKLWAILCLADYSLWALAWALISEHLSQKRKEENKDDDNIQR